MDYDIKKYYVKRIAAVLLLHHVLPVNFGLSKHNKNIRPS